MKYIDKYEWIIIDIKTIEESHKVQRFLYSYNITWGSDPLYSNIYNDKKCYYTFQIKNSSKKIINVYNYNDIDYIKSDYKTDGIIYELKDLYKIRNILEYGDYKPIYKPKRILRKI